MRINVDTEHVTMPLKNFWNHIHFHPTDAIEDQWGKNILDRVAGDSSAQYVRIYTMFEDIVSRDRNGKLVYDFSLNDKRIDYMIQKGFKLLICFNFMPPAIAKNPHQLSGMERYKGKRINFSEPENYEDWQEVVYTYVRHVVERYGLNTVSEWYLHCWNEPDWHYWLNNENTNYTEDKVNAYIKLYDHFAAGILRVTDRIKFGGPSAANHMEFIEVFIRHTKEGINTVTGAVGTRIDFVSIHTYSMNPREFSTGKYPSVKRLLEKTKGIHEIMKQYGYDQKEIIVDEWGASSRGFENWDTVPEVVYRDNEYHPAFLAKLVHDYILGTAKMKIPISMMMICLSGQHDLVKDFEGYRSFFTLNFFPKPIYNGYALLSKLGDQLLDCEISDPNGNLGVVPTTDIDGNVKVLLFYMEENPKKQLTNLKIKLRVKNLHGSYTLTHYRIDHTCSNSFTKWLELGRPENPDQLQREMINNAGKLSLYYPEEVLENCTEYEEDIIMSANSVSMLVLNKKTS